MIKVFFLKDCSCSQSTLVLASLELAFSLSVWSDLNFIPANWNFRNKNRNHTGGTPWTAQWLTNKYPVHCGGCLVCCEVPASDSSIVSSCICLVYRQRKGACERDKWPSFSPLILTQNVSAQHPHGWLMIFFSQLKHSNIQERGGTNLEQREEEKRQSTVGCIRNKLCPLLKDRASGCSIGELTACATSAQNYAEQQWQLLLWRDKHYIQSITQKVIVNRCCRWYEVAFSCSPHHRRLQTEFENSKPSQQLKTTTEAMRIYQNCKAVVWVKQPNTFYTYSEFEADLTQIHWIATLNRWTILDRKWKLLHQNEGGKEAHSCNDWVSTFLTVQVWKCGFKLIHMETKTDLCGLMPQISCYPLILEVQSKGAITQCALQLSVHEATDCALKTRVAPTVHSTSSQ